MIVLPCLLCVDKLDGLWATAMAMFRTEADRQLANKQRRDANELGVWFTVGSLVPRDKLPLTIEKFPYFLFR